MAGFRIVVALLPQVLLVLIFGGRFDLLGGLNRTDAGFGILIALFLISPLATAALLAVEFGRYLLLVRRKVAARSFLMPAVAIVLLLEALGVDVYMLSLMRMH